MRVELAIRGGAVVTPTGLVEGGVAIDGGTLVAVGKDRYLPSAEVTIDAHGGLILPGVIDPHVHFRDPGHTYKEDFGTGSAAAAFGGVTTVFDMPNTKPPPLDATSFHAKRDHIANRSWVNFALFGAIDSGNLDQIGDLARAGAIAFKVFMYQRNDPPPGGLLDAGQLLDAFQSVAATGLRVGVHAENDDVVRQATARVKAEGRKDARSHLDSRPAIAEEEAVARAMLFSAETGAGLHVCHMSSSGSVALVAAAKRRYLDVTAEATPQHLLLDASLYERVGTRLKMVPPVRDVTHRDALWQAVVDGTIDMVATDHAPHAVEEKLRDSPMDAASGIIGVETMLPLLASQVALGRLTTARLAAITSTNAARRFGLYPTKGAILPGSDADVVILRMGEESTIRSEQLHSRSRITPFENWKVYAVPAYTIVGGQVVMADAELVGEPHGKFVAGTARSEEECI